MTSPHLLCNRYYPDAGHTSPVQNAFCGQNKNSAGLSQKREANCISSPGNGQNQSTVRFALSGHFPKPCLGGVEKSSGRVRQYICPSKHICSESSGLLAVATAKVCGAAHQSVSGQPPLAYCQQRFFKTGQKGVTCIFSKTVYLRDVVR